MQKTTLKDVKSFLQTLSKLMSNHEILNKCIIENVNLKEENIYIIIQLPSESLEKYSLLEFNLKNKLKQTFKDIKEIYISYTQHTSNTCSIKQKPLKIAIASGKGGVGKSTTTVNLAIALKKLGYKIGLLDTDIYGPSIPKMLGVNQKPEITEDKKLIPLESYGIKFFSIGLLTAEEDPLIWRGPMLHGALRQLINDIDWNYNEDPLDILLIDTPPGTGDVSLTIAQQAKLDGVVIVSTPQDIALLDTRKSINMFKKLKIPVLGIIENMSYFSCPQCGHESHIFNHNTLKKEAQKFNIPFLGALPLNLEIREGCDKGFPAPLSNLDSDISRIYEEIVKEIIKNFI